MPWMIRKILAWCVHSYTALGLVAAGGIAVAIIDGRLEAIRFAFILMFIATIVDATDGTLARAVKVKEVLPHFDGRRLDDLIDFQTYTSLPLLLIWRTDLLQGESPAWLLAPLIASAYGFCQSTAKTDDGYFLGFPSYWNIVGFYIYMLKPPAWLAIAVLVFFALMTFVPARYLYPTHRGRLNRWTNVLGAIWGLLLVWLLANSRFPGPDGRETEPAVHAVTLISLLFPAYYLLVSWWISVRIWIRARHQMAIHQAHAASPAGEQTG
jgi:phosphatidylcholine synthase